MKEFKRYYNLEKYLFEELGEKFQRDQNLNVFDFFCIVIWKANRAKSKVAYRIRSKEQDLEKAIMEITQSIYQATDDKQRLFILMEVWKLRLPMSTAILSVLYPDRFTVYDYRVCEQIGEYRDLGNKINFDSIWMGYCQYKDSVHEFFASEDQLREKDKCLWGKSFHDDLMEDIRKGFPVKSKISGDDGH